MLPNPVAPAPISVGKKALLSPARPQPSILETRKVLCAHEPPGCVSASKLAAWQARTRSTPLCALGASQSPSNCAQVRGLDSEWSDWVTVVNRGPRGGAFLPRGPAPPAAGGRTCRRAGLTLDQSPVFHS